MLSPKYTKQIKVITLEVQLLHGSTRQYKAIDSDGKVLATRVECGNPIFIAALITKNHNHTFSYSILHLFGSIETIKVKPKKRIYMNSEGKKIMPYAIAIATQYKEAFQAFRNEKQV